MVTIVRVVISDVVLRLSIAYELKPAANNLRILAFISLAVALSTELDFKLRSPAHEGVRSIGAYRVAMTRSKRGTSHILHSSKPRGKSSGVQLRKMLDNNQLLILCELH